MTIAIFFVILIFAASLWYLGSPFFRPIAAPVSKDGGTLAKQDLYLKKEEILESLKDLELDHRTKKLSEEDFKALFEESFKEGTELLKRMDEKEAPPARFCSRCGETLAVNARFCAQCGNKVYAE